MSEPELRVRARDLRTPDPGAALEVLVRDTSIPEGHRWMPLSAIPALMSAIGAGIAQDGEDGLDGVPGPPGPAGSAGAAGAAGSAGASGPPGLDGADGEDGQSGAAGAPGATGSAGAAGAFGPPGMDGMDGDDGMDGIPGIPGTAGSAGSAGGSGPPGLDGEDGESGLIIANGRGAERTIGMTFDGGGSPPTAGSVGYIVCQFSGVLHQWAMVADAAGSAVVDVWKAASAIPTNGNTIAGADKPTLSAQQLQQQVCAASWTTAVSAGDVFGFELEVVTTCTRVTCEIRIIEQ